MNVSNKLLIYLFIYFQIPDLKTIIQAWFSLWVIKLGLLVHAYAIYNIYGSHKYHQIEIEKKNNVGWVHTRILNVPQDPPVNCFFLS